MNRQLITAARNVAGEFSLAGQASNTAGTVGAALVSTDGTIYTGICIDVACSLGFCAEHAALAEMLKDRKTRVERIVAVRDDGQIIPPCGRCREFLIQIDQKNTGTLVILGEDEMIPLGDILPLEWKK